MNKINKITSLIITNTKSNLMYRRKYIKKDFVVDIKKYKVLPLLKAFVTSVNDADLKSLDTLKVLNDELLSPVPISELLEDQNVRFSPDGNDVLPQTIMATFANLLLEVGRKDLGYKMVKSSGRITFNKKAFAECVMDYYSLKVNQSNPEELLVYNNEKGFWENGTQPLHRLIIEIAHSAGEDVIDTWT